MVTSLNKVSDRLEVDSVIVCCLSNLCSISKLVSLVFVMSTLAVGSVLTLAVGSVQGK